MAKRIMSPAEARLMFGRVQAKKAANAQHRREEDARRLECPVEQAKAFLRQRGWTVFAENVILRTQLTSRIIVGRTALEPEEVIAMAERVRERARLAA